MIRLLEAGYVPDRSQVAARVVAVLLGDDDDLTAGGVDGALREPDAATLIKTLDEAAGDV